MPLRVDAGDVQGGRRRSRCRARPIARDPNACYVSTASFADGSGLDRYGQRSRGEAAAPAAAKIGARGSRAAIRTSRAIGRGEQRVMTDPKRPEGHARAALELDDLRVRAACPSRRPGIPGARGTAVSLAGDPVDTYWNRRGSQLPLTPAGTAEIADWIFRPPTIRASTAGRGNIMFDWTFETDINRITQNADEIKISVRLDRASSARSTDSASIRRTSRRRARVTRSASWENDVLVVDTVGFAARHADRGATAAQRRSCTSSSASRSTRRSRR